MALLVEDGPTGGHDLRKDMSCWRTCLMEGYDLKYMSYRRTYFIGGHVLQDMFYWRTCLMRGHVSLEDIRHILSTGGHLMRGHLLRDMGEQVLWDMGGLVLWENMSYWKT